MRLDQENKKICVYAHDRINRTETPGCKNRAFHYVRGSGYCDWHWPLLRGYYGK